MYRVMAVDDEAIVRIAMQNIIQWEDYDMVFVGAASSGERALELVEEKQPDIIITDLVMGEMDGIALIQELRRRAYDGRIIVLSNYSEFEMVREAMKRGAFDYILKNSLIGANLVEVLEAAKKELEESRRVRMEADPEGRESLHQYVDIARQIRRNLLGDSYDKSLLVKNFPDGYYCMLNLICCSNDTTGENEKENFTGNIVEEVLGDKFLCIVHIRSGNDVVICRGELLESEFLLDKLISSIRVYTNEVYMVHVSSVFTKYIEMKAIYEDLQRLFSYAFYEEEQCSVLLFEKEKERFPKFSRELKLDLKEKLLQAVKSAEESVLKTALQNIEDYCRKSCLEPELLKKWLEVGLAQTVAALNFSDSYRQEELGKQYLKIQTAISFKQTLELLNDTCRYMMKIAGHKKMSYEVSRVLKYIEEHYQEKLSLDFLAGYVNFSPSYLTRVFKKETGRTISDYVNEYKINKAAELLLYQDMLVKEAAIGIGIDDQYYFSKLFKKYKGETPSQYYSRIQNRNH